MDHAALESSDWRRRLAALRASRDATAFPRETLIRLLGDEAADVRRRACELIRDLHDEALAAVLIDRANDLDKNVRNVIAEAVADLARNSPAVADLLGEAIADGEMRVRFLAARCWPNSHPAAALAKCLDDPEVGVRWAATKSLANRRARPHPEDADPEEPGLPAAAAEALREMQRRWIEGRQDPDPSSLAALVRAVGDSAPTVRATALRGLREVDLDDEMLAVVVEALNDADVRVRRAATGALGGTQDRKVVDPLRTMLADPDMWVRIGAIEGLLSASEDMGLLAARAALADRNRGVRAHVARKLGWMPDAGAVEPLIGLLNRSTSIEMRVTAAAALGAIGDERAVFPLSAALRDRRMQVGAWAVHPVRDSAERALRKIGTPEALAVLRNESL